jgi:hypothetical protein
MKRGCMIDAATAGLLGNTMAPPTLSEGQIQAEKILYEMEEDRFFLEFPDVAVRYDRRTARVDAGVFDVGASQWNAKNRPEIDTVEEVLEAA